MIRNILIGLVIALVIVVAGLSTALHISRLNQEVLKSELDSAITQYETIKTYITKQNESIEEAHKQLVKYQAEIEIIQREAEKRTKQLAEEVKKIATCEDGWKLLQKELQGLKDFE